ncbi:MAG: MBL fold metallo-hydrolase [Phycisphaerales bacterium]|jgi:glyoxylase-like metal-dependent hydrolase (beta-lactamase superfamily II)|nr:MBL fold metallo-hydrolase [Phycisphaerales bacterium]
MDWRVVSIGTLPRHPHWNERGDSRVGHATTSVIKTDGATLLVDPSLPPKLLESKLDERWGLTLSDISHVFLTSYDPDRRRTLGGLGHAKWLMHEQEILSASAAIQSEIERSEEDREVVTILNTHLELLQNFDATPDKPFAGVDLFPVQGFTSGGCGLLLPLPQKTVLITGDAVATREHVERGSVLQNCADIERAKESFLECVEIADVIIPGRDNLVFNSGR